MKEGYRPEEQQWMDRYVHIADKVLKPTPVVREPASPLLGILESYRKLGKAGK